LHLYDGMSTNKGTPTTLLEAIQNGLSDKETKGSRAEVIATHVKDFNAQRFGRAMLQAGSDEETIALKSLFDDITKKAA